MTLRLKEELSKLTQILRLILCLQLALATPLAQAEEPLELLYTRAIGGDLTQFLSGLDIGSEFFHYQDGMVYQATLISKSILPDGTPYFKVSLSSPGQADLPYTDKSSGTVPMPEGNGSGTGPMPEGTVGNNQTGGFGSDLINAGIASGAAIGGILITEFSGLSKAQAEYDRNMGKLRGRINEHREAIQNLIGQISEDQLRAGVALTRTQEVLKQVDPQALAERVRAALIARHQGWQSSPYTLRSFEFTSQDPEFLDRAIPLRDQLSEANIHAPGQALAYNVGQASLRAADKASVEGEKQLTQELLDVATVAADVLIGWDPFTGYARSFTEFFSGRNIITGEELGSIERTLAGFTLMTGVPGKPLRLTFRALSKATQHLPVISTRLAATLNRMKWALGKKESLPFAEGAIEHIWKGEFSLTRTSLKIRGGMHTHYGLKHFLAENERLGLKYIFKDVTKFPTINQEAGVILRQTLPNGVTRLQFPREAFSRMGWTAKTDNISRMKYFGFKSIFPESAGLTVLNKVSDSVVGASTSGRRHAYSYIRGIRVKVTLNSDLQIVTAFPD